MSLTSINPVNNETIKEYELLSSEDIKGKIENAHQAFLKWRNTSFQERAKLMHRAADVLEQNKKEYAHIMTLEMGKVRKEANSEIEKCAWVCRYYADHAQNFLSPEKLKAEKDVRVYYDPLGVVLAVMPWNFPFWQVFRFAAPGLMAGNAGLLKHASNVPETALKIEEVFQKAGFPDHLFQSLLIESKQVEEVIDHPMVKAATLTGSEGAGSAVASQAGKQLKKTVLELGGSDPFIVLADADIDLAAETAAKARMINCGQSCIAAKRFIIETSVFDEFKRKLVHQLNQMKQGDPGSEAIDYGPMARQDLAEELQQQVDRSVEKGAELVLNGGMQDKPGAWFSPVVLAQIPEESPAYREELFGPVASLFQVDDLEQAIRIANDSPYGLGAALWTSDRERALEAAHAIESGNVFINGMVASSPDTPFGGVKKSGYGRELSHFGIREFVNIKSVVIP